MDTHAKIKVLFLLPVIAMMMSCSKSFKAEPPLAGMDPKFISIEVNPKQGGVFLLENGTTITIAPNSLLDNTGKPLTEPVVIKYRQFDNAVSIFLAGLPMRYAAISDNMGLVTAGMFEMRAEANGKPITVNPGLPIKVKLGSNYVDTKQGFFQLNESTGDWQLADIPQWEVNPKVDSLRTVINKLKPEWTIPLPPNYYVFSLQRMADIFLNANYEKIYKVNLEALATKMKAYGVQSLQIDRFRERVELNGNFYDNGEILWKSDVPVIVPEWVSMILDRWDYDSKTSKWTEIYKMTVKDLKNKKFHFEIVDVKKNRHWDCTLEAVCHLRYLLKYTPEELTKLQASIQAEIEATEAKIRSERLIYYTVEVNKMGIFNCDRPIYYSPARPRLSFTLDGQPFDNNQINVIAAFNADLSSVSYPYPKKDVPTECPFFKGINKLLVITKDQKIGLLTGAEFKKLQIDTTVNATALTIPLMKVEVANEAELHKLLEQ